MLDSLAELKRWADSLMSGHQSLLSAAIRARSDLLNNKPASALAILDAAIEAEMARIEAELEAMGEG